MDEQSKPDKGLTQMASAKTPDAVLIFAYTDLFTILDRLLQLNSEGPRAMDGICQDIQDSAGASKSRRVGVAYKAGVFSNCSQDDCAGAEEEVRNALRTRAIEVYEASEDHISQWCKYCQNKVVPISSAGGDHVTKPRC
ncbi:hypothetical protein FVE85_4741 [Porphyridium purpureum]|uniref:Uncharacterized protein n=1 Tax=Porphyridium purpureum TaxID=35688 RepID=A0A5J4YSC8_PORPP|nr:hypothetical protein FVE85_4602 [Porphyridium purpureum]KAA8493604.1 hypothetical protein FVE85_4741 [Porphyridium purpureum]|eukprot:POR7496..scf236_6